MNNTIIKVENLSKQYRLGELGTGTISHDLNRWWHKIRGKDDPYLKIGETNDRSTKGNSEYVWALKDINFEVKQGEVLGIIGKNGAGKSTLLKLLSRVTAPTTGSIKAKGRIASLLEVGTGFHPELTGRENIFLNGAILGMTKAEIRSKLDEIIAFSGTERYIDTPVKRYSSGMRVRLAFAVAAHLDPEILIVDEVLAVGDAEFQKKAIGKMQDVSKGEGRTVLFVSHNMASIKSLCNSGVLLNNGFVTSSGKIDNVLTDYLNLDNTESVNFARRNQVTNSIAYFTNVRVFDINGVTVERVLTGDSIGIELHFVNNLISSKLDFYIGVYNSTGDKILHLSSLYSKIKLEYESVSNKGKVVCLFNKFPLPEGLYSFNLSLNDSNEILDHVSNAFKLQVEAGDFYGIGTIPPSSVNKVLVEQEWY